MRERNSNIELLRIFMMCGVIVLHFNSENMAGGLLYASGINRIILMCVANVFLCAVDLFMLIMGYFMCTDNARFVRKPVELLFQVIFFSEGLYIAGVLLGTAEFSAIHLVGKLVPANYFVILYIVTYLVSPAINVLLCDLSYKAAKRLLIVLMLFFSVWPTMVDVLSEITSRQWGGLSSIGLYGSQWGYTIVNFMLMYFIGAFLRVHGPRKLTIVNKKYIVLLMALSIFILTGWAVLNDKTGFFTERSAEEYCNPVVIGMAVMCFLVFNDVNLGTNRIINELSKGSFTVYLLHYTFLKRIDVEKIVQFQTPIMFLYLVACVLGIYILCWLVYKIYDGTINRILKAIIRETSILQKDIFQGCFETFTVDSRR